MRQQDLVRVRLRGANGVRQLGLQLKQPRPTQAASQRSHQRTSRNEQGKILVKPILVKTSPGKTNPGKNNPGKTNPGKSNPVKTNFGKNNT